ncbi:MAG: Uncharacterised protein [Prochlorococcus marinus str. MIT 9215]|nr:MAG: Uncharacterised protein [Prochlorococcus marinus str. MIT 9215]
MKSSSGTSDADEILAAINTANRSKGIKVSVIRQGSALSVRATWRDPGETKPQQRRLSLGLSADQKNHLREADKQAKAVWSAIKQGEDPRKAVTSKKQAEQQPRRALFVRDAVEDFEQTYFQERKRTPSTERSFKRLLTELNRLPPAVELSMELLVETARRRTEPDSRTRLECVMVFKRLAKHCDLEQSAELDLLRGNYAAVGPKGRDIPGDEKLIEFLRLVRPSCYGWCTCAMAVFGVRPGEVPSLVLAEDGFASCLTTKLKRALPTTRDVMALPNSWVVELNLHDVSIPGNNRWTKPEEYNSDVAQRFVNNWNQWWKRQPTHLKQARAILPKYQNYDLRHAWALRAINRGISTNIAAKAMGHSEATHIKHYERWLNKDELRLAMQKIDRG